MTELDLYSIQPELGILVLLVFLNNCQLRTFTLQDSYALQNSCLSDIILNWCLS